MTYSSSNLYNAVLKWLARREHSTVETIQYLKKKGASDTQIEEIIQYLLSKQYIDDTRVSIMYIEHCKKKLYSRFVCKMKLLEKGIAKELAEELINQHYTYEDEEYIAEKLVKKLLRQNKTIDKILLSLKRKAFYDGIIIKLKGEYYDNQ